jgi:uncharacterized protein YlxW (UPF0749 family)
MIEVVLALICALVTCTAAGAIFFYLSSFQAAEKEVKQSAKDLQEMLVKIHSAHNGLCDHVAKLDNAVSDLQNVQKISNLGARRN